MYRKRMSSYKAIYVPPGISAGRGKRLVFDGVYKKTRGGLVRSQLVENKQGKVVSRKKQQIGRRLQREYGQSDEFLHYKGRINEYRR